MKKMCLLGFLLFIGSPTFANPQDAIFYNFSSCSGSIDSIPVRLDFFEEMISGTSSGKGYVVQTMGPINADNLKMMGKIDVSDMSGKQAKLVTMYALLEPSVAFATFEIDLSKQTQVEIFATNFNDVWAKLTCKPMVVPFSSTLK